MDFGTLKTVTVVLKKLSDVVSKKVVKNTKFTTLNTKANELENINITQINRISRKILNILR